MLTRCPACSTRFRVTTEQLKARAGKVRCGHCRTQFNALDTLLEEPVVPPATSTPTPEPEVAVQAADEPVAPLAVEVVPDAAATIMETPVAAPVGVLPDALPPEEIDAPPQADNAPSEAPLFEEPYDIAFDAPPEKEGRTSRRWLWTVGSCLALLALLAQAALYYRVELAVLQPRLKPALLAACQRLGCEIPLPRHAEFLGIEASDLHPDPQQQGLLALSATLRNRAPFAQEFPAIELTLNDVADQPLIVKVLQPSDYLPAAGNPGKGFATNGEIAVKLALDVGDTPAAGYRMYLFYP